MGCITFGGGKAVSQYGLFLKVFGFISFIAIFFLSGWKAGLIAIPIIVVASFVGALIARQLRE